MLSMLVYFSSAQLVQSTALTPCYYVRTEDYSQKTIPTPRLNSHSHALNFHSHPIPIPWLILFPLTWESHGTHGIPVFPIPMPCTPLLEACQAPKTALKPDSWNDEYTGSIISTDSSSATRYASATHVHVRKVLRSGSESCDSPDNPT